MASGVLDRFRSWLFAEEEETEVGPPEVDREAEPRRRKASLLSLHSSRNEEIFLRWPKDRERLPRDLRELRLEHDVRRPVHDVAVHPSFPPPEVVHTRHAFAAEPDAAAAHIEGVHAQARDG